MKLISHLGVGVLVLLSCTSVATPWQVAATGGVTGNVSGPDGKPLAGAQVSVLAVADPVASIRQPVVSKGMVATVTSSTGGAFTFSGLPPGKYFACGNMPSSELVDPCTWSAQVTTVTVVAGSVTAAGSVTLVQGTTLQVVMNYLPSLLGSSSVANELKHLLVGLWPTSGRGFTSVPLVSETATGRVHKTVVPLGSSFQLGFHAANLQIQDSKLQPLNLANPPIAIFVPTTSGTQTVIVNVLGLGLGVSK